MKKLNIKIGLLGLYMLLSMCRGASKTKSKKEQTFRDACYDGNLEAVRNGLKDEDKTIMPGKTFIFLDNVEKQKFKLHENTSATISHYFGFFILSG